MIFHGGLCLILLIVRRLAFPCVVIAAPRTPQPPSACQWSRALRYCARMTVVSGACAFLVPGASEIADYYCTELQAMNRHAILLGGSFEGPSKALSFSPTSWGICRIYIQVLIYSFHDSRVRLHKRQIVPWAAIATIINIFLTHKSTHIAAEEDLCKGIIYEIKHPFQGTISRLTFQPHASTSLVCSLT